MQDSALLAQHAFAQGALGFVLIDAADQELGEAVRRVAAGQIYRSPRLRQP
jgi:DNA-binding NarL/FixJ family response regulator